MLASATRRCWPKRVPSSSSPEPPPDVTALAEQRAVARAERDFSAADRLRDEIGAAGWVVTDAAAGYTLAPRPPYDVLPTVTDLPDHSAAGDTHRVTVSVLVDGWPDDARRCLDALLSHTADHVLVQVLDNGAVDGAGEAVHEFAGPRLQEWHVGTPAGWSAARTALLRADTATVHVWCDASTVLTGDAVEPLVAAVESSADVVGAGWRGADVDLADEWRSFVDAGPGDVDALLGYLFAMRRSVALATGGPHPKARFYRNADLEFSLALREAARGLGSPGRLVAVPDLPCRQDRHRGYHDSDPAYRDRESARTYARLLQRFRGRPEVLRPRD